MRVDIAVWLDSEDDERISEVPRVLLRRHLALGKVERMRERIRTDPLHAKNPVLMEKAMGEAIAACEESIQAAQDLLDEVMNEGMRKRIGYRLNTRDREVYSELVKFGATGRLSGVAVCADCVRVFEPKRKSTAERCDKCSRNRPPVPVSITLEETTYSYMKFDRDPLRNWNAGAEFVGWGTRRFAWCRECDQVFEASRKDQVTCSGACREARRKRRAGGDKADLSSAAQESRARRELMRAVSAEMRRASEGLGDASDNILRLLDDAAAVGVTP